MDDLLADFVAETREMLEASGGEIVAWEADPSDKARLDTIFRFVHTVKGNCGFFDFPRLERLSHAAEDALAECRGGRREPDPVLVSAVLAIIDRISAMTDAIEALAAQDLSHDIPSPENSDFPEQFNGIRESFNAAIGALRQVISGIRTSAQQLDSGALEVSQASQDLSQRTESQAATLEQTAAAVEEITVSMRSSAEATQQTSGAVDTTRQRAEEGSVVVRNAVEKMNEIADSSAQISKIISVIDDISFQTNLLALNAGVEAARAGESGRGFAVVASEVRNLAQRTADSAGEIKELIDISTKHVESGVELVGNAGEMLESIVNHINEAADLTQQVASSAEQQSTAFGEINIGVSQLDSVTQQNAAMVEQSTAALMEMRNEASTLSGLVSVFQLGSGGQSGGFEGAQDAAFRNVG